MTIAQVEQKVKDLMAAIDAHKIEIERIEEDIVDVIKTLIELRSSAAANSSAKQ